MSLKIFSWCYGHKKNVIGSLKVNHIKGNQLVYCSVTFSIFEMIVECLFCRSVILFQIAFYFIIEDFIFYWGHRVLHTKWLYKHVHSVHHE